MGASVSRLCCGGGRCCGSCCSGRAYGCGDRVLATCCCCCPRVVVRRAASTEEEEEKIPIVDVRLAAVHVQTGKARLGT